MYAGIKNNKGGYEGMVEAAKAVSRNFNQTQQCGIVIQALEKAFPRPILTAASSFSYLLIPDECCTCMTPSITRKQNIYIHNFTV